MPFIILRTKGEDQRHYMKKKNKESTASLLFDIFLHKFLVELRTQRIVDEALLLPCLVHSFCTIFEHDIIVPPKKSINILTEDDWWHNTYHAFTEPVKCLDTLVQICLFVCEIPSLDPECSLTLGLRRLSGQINQRIATQDIFHPNPLLLSLLLSVLKLKKKKRKHKDGTFASSPT